ncbi:hypothetical protein ElyMa_006149800 [Elysia marginata]|uniref:Apple domain-containing protein n=1 Tax=Elysia marginata TaxID=1093978 RepID=A0AAV4GZE4_9GAST|nr:hypothetical protein ElyMa_006149800 [Elysia marginata]
MMMMMMVVVLVVVVVVVTTSFLTSLELCGLMSSMTGYVVLCTYSDTVRDVQGETWHSHKPRILKDGQYLRTTKASSYLNCVSLCGLDNWCRAAEFNIYLSNCTTYDSTMFSGYLPSADSKTFVRLNYEVPETIGE